MYPTFIERFPDLTEPQLRLGEAVALRTLLYPGKTLDQIFKIHGISRSTYFKWKRTNPQFNQYMIAVSELVLVDAVAEANELMVKLLRSDNEKTQLDALKLFMQLSGRLQPGHQTNITIEHKAKDEDEILKEIRELERKMEIKDAEFEELE